MIPREPQSTIRCGIWYPMDDDNTWVILVLWHKDRRPTDEEAREIIACRDLIPGTWYPKQNASNDYMIDREVSPEPGPLLTESAPCNKSLFRISAERGSIPEVLRLRVLHLCHPSEEILMIIDVHGHYTTAPPQLKEWRNKQIANIGSGSPFTDTLTITDDEIRETIENGQLKFQLERGTDVALFSPTAGGMAHHYGDESTSLQWTQTVNDLVKRVSTLFPDSFIPVCQLPQSPGVSPANCIAELDRCVSELGFVACNLNPDPSDGYWTDPPMTDKWWYPLYERMVELEVPAMIHVSMSCNPNFHGTGAHYINGDTSFFMQMIEGDLFKDFPTLKFVIPHGGGAVPYHWGRYRGIAQDMGKPTLDDHLMNNIFFDTCVYHQRGIDLLADVISADNILFASEMIGAVKGIDAGTGRYFDDTKPYIEGVPGLSEEDKAKIYEGNARKVYPLLQNYLK